MKRMLIAGSVLVVGVILVMALLRSPGEEEQAAPMLTAAVPMFEVDPSWPRLPEGWILGEVSSIGVDAQDNILILHRPRSLHIHAPDSLSFAAPPVLEFDPAGNFLRAWGGDGEGFQWPQREHGIHVDYNGNIWVGGNNCPANNTPGLEPMSDDQIVKFTRDGQFLLQIGRSNQGGGNSDTENLRNPADLTVYTRTNEVFVADGYANRRVIVFDADTGEFKRMWGAFGNEPFGGPYCPFATPESEIEGDGPLNWDIVHGIAVSNDGIVYVADRSYGRVQVFTIDGEFLRQTFMPNGGGAGDVAFSPDPGQRFLYVASSGEIVMLDRQSLEVLYSFPGSGHHIATDSEGNIYTAQVGSRRLAQKLVYKGMSPEQSP